MPVMLAGQGGARFHGAGAPPAPLLLDTLTFAPAAAYSLRKLRAAYSGSAIRVRRTSDNAQQDIGFSGNDLDTASLASFCNGTDGYVVTWYDQSTNSEGGSPVGSTRQVTNSDTTRQMRIVLNGTVDTGAGGKPKLFVPNTTERGYWSAALGTAYTGQQLAVCSVAKIGDRSFTRVSSVGDGITSDGGGSLAAALITRNSSNNEVGIQRGGSFIALANIVPTELTAISSRISIASGGTIKTYLETANAAHAAANFAVKYFFVGVFQENGAAYRAGNNHESCEHIFWFTDPSATEVDAVMADQRTYWGAS